MAVELKPETHGENPLIEGLERLPGVLRAVPAGEVRRRMEVVRELVVVLVATRAGASGQAA